MTNKFYSEFPAKLDMLDDVLAFAEGAEEELGCSMKYIMQVSLALEEAFVNVANYAYPGTEGNAWLSIESDGENAVYTLSDSGIPFDPVEKEDPDITLSAEERNIGGLGIFMVKKIMDKVSYSYTGNKNVLVMEKKLS